MGEGSLRCIAIFGNSWAIISWMSYPCEPSELYPSQEIVDIRDLISFPASGTLHLPVPRILQGLHVSCIHSRKGWVLSNFGAGLIFHDFCSL